MAYTPSIGASSKSIAGAVNVVLSHYDASDRIGSYSATGSMKGDLTSECHNLATTAMDQGWLDVTLTTWADLAS